MILSAFMVSPMSIVCMNSPNREPSSIVSKVASSVASISGVMSVEPWITPAERAITLCDTSNTAFTMLNVLERMRMAAAVLNIHLKKSHVSMSDEYCQDGFSNETVNTLRTS